MKLQEYTEKIESIFKQNKDRYECHKIIAPLLIEMSYDKEFLFEVIRKNLLDKDFLARERHYSTLSMNIHEHSDFNLVINIFPPLPDRNTDVSFQSIHHHGTLLLSTIGIFGDGYSSIVYNKDYKIDTNTNEANLTIKEYYINKNHEVKFIDAFQPHVVFYPASFSATLVLWSDYKSSNKEKIKRIPFVNHFKKPLGKIIRKLGIEDAVGINKIVNYDFYRDSGKYFALKNRVSYTKKCSNQNFIHNFFSYIQQYGFRDESFLQNLKENNSFPKEFHYLIDSILENEIIAESFCEHHLNIPYINLLKIDLLD